MLIKWNQKIRGVKEKQIFSPDQPVEMTITRADEIKRNIKNEYGIDVDYERMEEEKTEVDAKSATTMKAPKKE